MERRMDSFEVNPDSASLSPIQVGDNVQVRSSSGLGHLLKCRVEEVFPDSLRATVVAVYEPGGSPIKFGWEAELVGTSLPLEKKFIQKVVQVPDGRL